jgi:hypothetical protein
LQLVLDRAQKIAYSLLAVLPGQITLVGSDGQNYTFLAKPKDDLRKDHRMMEVAGIINRLFAREPSSRRRNLYIRRCAARALLCAGPYYVLPITCRVHPCALLPFGM